MADYDDLGVMQAQLGLGARGSMSPLGIPTPMPQVRHPSEAARDAVQMSQSSAMQTMQAVSMINAAAAGGMGFGSGLGGFASQYQANMANIRSNQLSPWGAGMTSSMMGMGGYMPGMMPSPIQMTPSNMGIYRPTAAPPMMTMPPVPPTPFIPGPFTPQLPPPMFTTNFERSQQLADYRGHQATAMALSVPGVAARAGVDIAGSRMGAGLGALAGARLGGVPGAAIGGAIGAIGGFLGAENFLGQGVQNAVDDMNPIARMSRQAAQVRGMSRDFVVGGNALDVTGSGLNRTGSVRLARQMHNLAGESGFQRETGGMFSSQDLMKITSLSGQQGLLDMAQNPDQITGQVKNIAKALKSFMKLAGEPDVTEAIKQLGQMRSMGLSLGESMLAVERAKSYGRMAGTSVQGIMQMGGLPGAMVFQQQGLSAGLGMQVGMGSLGMARQAVAGGTFSPAQLSMLGGVQGVAQNNMEMSAAMLKQPLMAAAMSNFNPASGGFQLNPNAVGGLARGQVGLQGMANMGVSNMMRAVQQGGIGALGAFQMDQSEMQDQLGRALGPEGIKIMGMQQILNTRKFLGVKGRGGLFAAAKSMGFSDDQAKQSVQEMGSPEFMENMQRQIRITEQQTRAEERELAKARAPTFTQGLSEKYAPVRGAMRGLRTAGAMFDDVTEALTGTFARYGEEGAAEAVGQTVRRTDRRLLASSPLETRMMSKLSHADLVGSGAFDMKRERDTSLFRIGGRGYLNSSGAGDLRDYLGGDEADLKAYRKAQGGFGELLGGGGLESTARYSLLGGFGMFASGSDVRAELPNIQRGAEATARGLNATSTDRKDARQRLEKALGEGGGDKVIKLQSAFERVMSKKARENYNMIGGNKALTGESYDASLKEAAAEAGISESELSKLNAADLQAISVKGAKTMSGAEGSGSWQTAEALGESSYKGTMDALAEAQTTQSEGMFGSMGTATQREKMADLLLSGDEDARVGTLAALMASSGTNKVAGHQLEAYRKELRAQGVDIDELEERAGTMVTTAGTENLDFLKEYGSKLSSSSVEDMAKETEGRKKSRLGRKEVLKLGKGLETFADKSTLSGFSAGDPVEQLLKQDESKIRGPQMQALAKKYKSAASGEARAAVLEEASSLARGAGYVSETENVGGDIGASAKKAQVTSETLAGVSAEALKEFPDAVRSFTDASRALEKAANQLGNATALTPSVNNFTMFGG